LEYQQVIEIFIDCISQWGSKKKQHRGKGISGRVIAFTPAHKEQGQKMFHLHWQIWVKELLPQVSKDLWHTDHKIRGGKCKDFYRYVDKEMNATYSTK
jgi:galactose-1-phosphate uridylyltransferase